MMYSIVKAKNSTYICENIEYGSMVKLVNAVTIIHNDEDVFDMRHLAILYIQELIGDIYLSDVEISPSTNLIIDSDNYLTSIIEVMKQFIPLAKKKAENEAVISEFNKLVGFDDDEE